MLVVFFEEQFIHPTKHWLVLQSFPHLQKAMAVKQVKQAELGVCDVIDKKLPVYTKDTNLVDAKTINGLRAVFDEVCAGEQLGGGGD